MWRATLCVILAASSWPLGILLAVPPIALLFLLVFWLGHTPGQRIVIYLCAVAGVIGLLGFLNVLGIEARPGTVIYGTGLIAIVTLGVIIGVGFAVALTKAYQVLSTMLAQFLRGKPPGRGLSLT